METDEENNHMTRRRFLQAATVAASGVAGLGTAACKNMGAAARDFSPLATQARVTILHAGSYDKNLSDLLRQVDAALADARTAAPAAGDARPQGHASTG